MKIIKHTQSEYRNLILELQWFYGSLDIGSGIFAPSDDTLYEFG